MVKELPAYKGTETTNLVRRAWRWVGLALIGLAILLKSWLPGIIVAIFYLFGIVVIANLLFHLHKYLRAKIFWRVRSRLLASFVFVGVIPIVLLLGVVFLSAYLFLGQMAAAYFSSSLKELQGEVSSINAELAGALPPESIQTALEPTASQIFQARKALLSHASVRLLKAEPDGSFQTVARFNPSGIVKKEKQNSAALWLDGKRDFEGILFQDNRVLITSLRSVLHKPDYYLDVSVPFDEIIEQRLANERSLYIAIVSAGTRADVDGVSIPVEAPGDTDGESEPLNSRIQSISDRDPRMMITRPMLLEGKNFTTGEGDHIALAFLRIPLTQLIKKYLAPTDIENQMILALVYFLAGLFVIMELVSLVTGIMISRRITRSVHQLYQGTIALQSGNLEYRIPVQHKDQLGLLAHSFNEMSASITKLLEEVTEKKRLEQELEIAREVQATLFPKQLPHPCNMTIFGGCKPARVVSGDYYDFIGGDEPQLHIVVGDISGKGISAALMMANLQAAMRNQLLSIKPTGTSDVERDLAGIIANINQQIYLNSPPEKYATLFIGCYRAETRQFLYSNAGHLSPLLLNDGEVTRLGATGTVLGLFPDLAYEAHSIKLDHGTVLAIYTDGVTEAVNASDEDFGENRLIEVLQEFRARSPKEIYQRVIDRVGQWQGRQKQHDDITLIIAKVV